jgi:hypothetical protein
MTDDADNITISRTRYEELLAMETQFQEWGGYVDALRETQFEIDNHNEELNATEPDEYQLVVYPKLRTHRFGNRDYKVGFCTNSEAGGYTDHCVLWVNDDIVEPDDFIQVCVHESLHAVFPGMAEGYVHIAGKQIADFIVKAFEAKGAKPLPKLRRLSALPKSKLLSGPPRSA